MKGRVLSAAIFIAVLLGYFLAEALLRRKLYYAPPEGAAGKEALIKHLPDFLQNYFKERQKIASVERQLEKAEDPKKRIKLMYELGGLVSEAESRALMEQVVAEAPDSPAAARAWAVVMQDMTEEQILTEYLDYIERCDIRSQQEKLTVWQTGLGALAQASQEGRMKYIRKMAEARVVSEGLIQVYEELWVRATAEGDDAMAAQAKELQTICREMLAQNPQKR